MFCCRYVDGQDYMESVANAIMKVANTSKVLFLVLKNLSKSYLYCFSFENIFSEKSRRKSNAQAKEEIFITDWWLSPELRLKVNPNNHIKNIRFYLNLSWKARERGISFIFCGASRRDLCGKCNEIVQVCASVYPYKVQRNINRKMISC